ncbi:MAG: hemolysin family protein [Candidatus Woesearchaeota archaeon]
MDFTLILFIITLCFSGFFSGSEVAILGITHIKAKQMVHYRVPRAKHLLYLKEHTSETLITILIGNNIVNILGTVLATKFTIDTFGDVYLGLATGILTFLVLTFGEILPKTLASKNAKPIALFVSPILVILIKILFPLVWMFNKLTAFFNSFGKKRLKEPLVTEQEIKYLVMIGEREGEINEQEKEIINNVFKFNDIKVEDIMTKKEDVVMLEWDTKLKDALPILEEQAYSRIPVYDRTTKYMKGVVRVQDAMNVALRNENDNTLRDLVDYTVFIHPDKKIDYALKMLQLRHVHMAIVIDKKRRFQGILTMEDILEELVGEIFDESDRLYHLIKRIDKKEWVVSTKIDVRALNKRLRLHLPVTETFKTLATLLKENIINPKNGSKYYFERDSVTFVVRKTLDKNIIQVLVRKK